MSIQIDGRGPGAPWATLSAAERWEESHFLAAGDARVWEVKNSSGLEKIES